MRTFASPKKKVSGASRALSPAVAPPAPGSAAVRHILHSPRPQAKLTVGAPDDAFEKEADQVAGQVMRMPEPRVQRVVDFQADFSNVSVTPQAAAAIAAPNFTYADAAFSANADVTATGDTVAELDQWDVGVFQDMVVNWEREYWRRNNADGLGRYVEQKFLPVNTRFRDQATGAATIWSADSEHQLLSGVAKTPAGARFQAATTVVTTDNPGGQDTIDGSGVPGMNASDGTANVDIQRIGSRFDTWISAHNTVTNELRHLRRLNWNYMRSLDFTGSGGTLAVGPENGQTGHHGPYGAGRAAPLTAGTTANAAMGNNANWARRRVNGWT